MTRLLLRLSALVIALFAASVASAIEVKTAVLRVDYPEVLPISRFDLKPADLGFAGAQLATEDNRTTGGFLGHTYETEMVAAPPDGADAAMQRILDAGIRLIVVIAKAGDLLRLTDLAEGSGALVFNASAPEVSLRDDQCRGNLLHIAPSSSMETDAVAQFAMWKQWDTWLLVEGSNEPDQLLAQSFRRSAKKFGAKVVSERVFEDTGGTRRTDSGHVLVQRQLPVFMQRTDEHDVVMAADRTDYFARYLPYHLWMPRPVMGSAGLRPVTMHGAHEAWGATQFHNRFEDITSRYMTPIDYNTWLALRVVGEAVTRANTAEAEGVKDYALSDAFELAAFKGQKVTFRDWNGQLRQPILLFDGSITVSVSPQEGYLHQVSPLDTLGLDRPESKCTAFN
ncbi:ABC transporter substrate-binding protein [Tropicibacter sp. S64]|uniref:ABC transporter substrate-binding protein n=1 Tax=Tropicibacter sp. S64 TaxID=3415122 RepID=UPI003C7982E4